MGATCKNRFVPSLELLGERVVPATIGGEAAAPESAARDGYVLTGVSHSATLEGQTALEGHEALVFYLG